MVEPPATPHTDPRLAAALDRLVLAGTLTPEQATAVRAELADAVRAEPAGTAGTAEPAGPAGPATGVPVRAWTQVLAEIGGYVGGAFVFGAATVLISDRWGSLRTANRLAVLGVPAALLLAAAFVVAATAPGGWRRHGSLFDLDPIAARRRVVSVFTTVASILAGFAAGVAAQAQGVDDDAATAAAWATALVVAAVAYAATRGELAHLAFGTTLIGAVLAASEALPGQRGQATAGVLLATVGVAWAASALMRVLGERELGVGYGGLLAFVGGELLTGLSHGLADYVVLFGLAVAGLGGFLVLRSVMLLVVGTGTLAVVVPQVVIDLTDGALGAAGALLAVGLSIVGASVLGLRLHRTRPPD